MEKTSGNDDDPPKEENDHQTREAIINKDSESENNEDVTTPSQSNGKENQKQKSKPHTEIGNLKENKLNKSRQVLMEREKDRNLDIDIENVLKHVQYSKPGKLKTVLLSIKLPWNRTKVERDRSQGRTRLGMSKLESPSFDMDLEDNAKRKNKPIKNIAASIYEFKSRYSIYLKMGFLIVLWLIISISLIIEPEAPYNKRVTIIPAEKTLEVFILQKPKYNRLEVSFNGAFRTELMTAPKNYLEVTFRYYMPNGREYQEIQSKRKLLPMADDLQYIDNISQYNKNLFFDLTDNEYDVIQNQSTKYSLIISSNIAVGVPLQYDLKLVVAPQWYGVVLGLLILTLMYALIIFEVLHRTFASMLASALSIAALSCFYERPSMHKLVGFIDFGTILLLFSMMIIVAILAKTGVFDYAAVFAYKLTKGRIWPLIHFLCLFASVLSLILDNVTTILLIAPIIIRICEVSNIKPQPVLIIVIICCNIAGAGSPMGDPPNIMVVSDPYLAQSGMSFGSMLLHMSPGVILIMVAMYVQIRYIVYRKTDAFYFEDVAEIVELKREVTVWKQTEQNMATAYTSEEDLIHNTIQRKIDDLNNKLANKQTTFNTSRLYVNTLMDLQIRFPIRDKKLLVYCVICLSLILLFFFLNSLPGIHYLSYGWVTLLGLMLLLILYTEHDMDHCLHQVEWPTLLFFANLFVLMECLYELGLIPAVGDLVEDLIMSVSPVAQLPVAICLILWTGGVMSSIMENIPVTSMMLKILRSINENPKLTTPILPLAFALLFACGLGGNGTLIASSSNIVGVSIAETHGYKLSFTEFFKISFPVMISSLILATVYLIIVHVALNII